jgi:hypothetical protein
MIWLRGAGRRLRLRIADRLRQHLAQFGLRRFCRFIAHESSVVTQGDGSAARELRKKTRWLSLLVRINGACQAALNERALQRAASKKARRCAG